MNLNKNILVIIGIFVFTGGCSLAPKYTEPKIPVPADWPAGEVYKEAKVAPGVQAAPQLSRQDFFTDPKLQQIIETALNNNRDLKLAALNVEMMRAYYGIQRAEMFPSVNAAGTGSRQQSATEFTSPGESRTTNRFDVNLGISSWEIDLFGRIRNLKDQALEEYMATEEARRGTQVALVSEVAMEYLTLAADLENLKLARSTLETQQGIYDLIQRQYEVGLVNELDLRRAQTQVDAARGDVAGFTQMAALDQNALNLLVGSPVSDDLLPADLASIHPPREVFAGLSSEALLYRPDVIAAEHRLKGAYAYIGAARAALFPRISLTTLIGTVSRELSGLFKSGSGTWSYAPQIGAPIFDLRTRAAYRVSKTERDIALAQYEKTIQTAFREVADALAVQGTIDQQIAAQQSLTDAVADTYRLSNKRYLIGIDSYLGVLDAQRSLYAAQRGLILLRLGKLVNEVRLYAVFGGGGE